MRRAWLEAARTAPRGSPADGGYAAPPHVDAPPREGRGWGRGRNCAGCARRETCAKSAHASVGRPMPRAEVSLSSTALVGLSSKAPNDAKGPRRSPQALGASPHRPAAVRLRAQAHVGPAACEPPCSIPNMQEIADERKAEKKDGGKTRGESHDPNAVAWFRTMAHAVECTNKRCTASCRRAPSSCARWSTTTTRARPRSGRPAKDDAARQGVEGDSAGAADGGGGRAAAASLRRA